MIDSVTDRYRDWHHRVTGHGLTVTVTVRRWTVPRSVVTEPASDSLAARAPWPAAVAAAAARVARAAQPLQHSDSDVAVYFHHRF